MDSDAFMARISRRRTIDVQFLAEKQTCLAAKTISSYMIPLLADQSMSYRVFFGLIDFGQLPISPPGNNPREEGLDHRRVTSRGGRQRSEKDFWGKEQQLDKPS